MRTNQQNSPNKGQGKNSENQKNKTIQPDFSDLKKSKIYLNEKDKLEKTVIETVSHGTITERLLEEIKPIDFEKEVNPNTDDFKIKQKHYLIISVEKIIQVAKNNDWGICKNHDFIYLFNGAYWSIIDKEKFQKFLGEAAEKMDVSKYTARYYDFREKLFKQFQSTAYLPKPVSNPEKVLINLKNGTFEVTLDGLNLKPFNRADFLTYQLPFKYDPEATAPKFKNYLNRVLPDKEKQQILAEYLGYVFLKNGNNSMKIEKALLLYGTGANGKSVFFEIVNALLGKENIGNCTLEELTNSNGYYRATIANKLVNYGSEINNKIGTSFFKQLVSGEPVSARLPYGQPFTIYQYAKMIFNANELPQIVEHTNAYYRRFLIINFDVTIPKEEQDSNLHTKIIENELSGVFNWVLYGLKRLLTQKGFSKCKAADEALEQYKKDSDSVKLFIDEYNYVKSVDSYVLTKELFQTYKDFCIDNELRPVGSRNFSKRLRTSGITIDRVTNNQPAAFLKIA